jgi:hypothetical protein
MILFDKNPESQDTTAWKTAVEVANTKIKQLTNEKQALLIALKEDSIKAVKKNDSLKTKLRAKSAEVVRLKNNPRVIYVREQEPEVDSLINFMDSVNIIKEARINLLEDSHTKFAINMQAVLDNCEERIKVDQERHEAQKALTEVALKENKKLKRGNRWLKVGALVGIVGGIFLGGL